MWLNKRKAKMQNACGSYHARLLVHESLSTLISFQSRKLHSFKALLSTIGVTSRITCCINNPAELLQLCNRAG